jgi:dihydropteroate synthase
VKLRLRDRVLELDGRRPLLMGIVNVNPDSFSDAERTTTTEAAVARALRLVEDGADLIDVGGESGVTYTGVTAEEVEAQRVVPVVERLVAEGVVVSVDTWKAGVAQAAVDAGAHLLNDVSGLRDERLADVAAASGAGLVLMHTRAEPKVEHFHDYGGDVVGDVVRFLGDAVARARARGVADEQLLLDPGPDFAKTPAESIEVLRELPRLSAFGRPVLLACSRKYYVGAITGRPPAERLGGTLGALVAHLGDVHVARLHDVREAADLLEVLAVMRGEEALGKFDPGDDALKWIRASDL